MMCAWIGKFAQQVKALAAKPEDLMLLPESYIKVDGPRHGGICLLAQHSEESSLVYIASSRTGKAT